MITVKNSSKIILLMGALSVALTGCGNPKQIKDANESTLLIQEDKVYCISIEEFDESLYSKEDLKDSIQSAISEYQEQNGKESVAKQSFKVKNDLARLCLEYDSLEHYIDFTLLDVSDCEMSIFLSTNSDYAGKIEWKNQLAQVVTFEEIERGSNLRILYGDFQEELTVIFENHEILYYGGSISQVAGDTAYVKQDGDAYIVYK